MKNKQTTSDWEKIITEARKSVNWEFESLLENDNFDKKLEEAIGNDNCMLCHNSRVLHSLGLCIECAQFLDKKLEKRVNDGYKIEAYMTVNVTKKH